MLIDLPEEFKEIYKFDTEKDTVYNTETGKYLKLDEKRKVYNLRDVNNKRKGITKKFIYENILGKRIVKDNIKDLPNEEWKEIKGHKDYFISSCGRVKSYKGYDAKILKQRKSEKGYKLVDLDEKTERVHRLVAKAFIPIPDNIKSMELVDITDGLCVHHVDFDTSNNQVNNLRWMTKENHDALHSLIRANNWIEEEKAI